MRARSASSHANLISATRRSSSLVGKSYPRLNQSLRSRLYSFILDLQQRATTSQSRTGTAEYVTPGSLDTNINVGGPSDHGESGVHRTWSIVDIGIAEAPPHMSSPRGDVSESLPPDDSLLDSRSSTNNGSKGLDPIASALVNPLSAGQSKFMASAQGRECECKAPNS